MMSGDTEKVIFFSDLHIILHYTSTLAYITVQLYSICCSAMYTQCHTRTLNMIQIISQTDNYRFLPEFEVMPGVVLGVVSGVGADVVLDTFIVSLLYSLSHMANTVRR